MPHIGLFGVRNITSQGSTVEPNRTGGSIMTQKNKTTTPATVQEQVVFTKEDRNILAQATCNIDDAQRRAEGLAQTIAGNLWVISKKKLYMLEDYASLKDFAKDRFNIAAGTSSDAVNTYARFGKPEIIGQIKDEYADFKFSTLIAMKSLSDEEINALGIKPDMSRARIKEIIANRKSILDTQKDRDEAFEAMNKQVAILHKDGIDPEDIKTVIEDVVPGFFNPEKVNTFDEISLATEAVKEKVYENHPDLKPEPEAEKNSTVEPVAATHDIPGVVVTDISAKAKKAILAEIWEKITQLEDGQSFMIIRDMNVNPDME